MWVDIPTRWKRGPAGKQRMGTQNVLFSNYIVISSWTASVKPNGIRVCPGINKGKHSLLILLCLLLLDTFHRAAACSPEGIDMSFFSLFPWPMMRYIINTWQWLTVSVMPSSFVKTWLRPFCTLWLNGFNVHSAPLFCDPFFSILFVFLHSGLEILEMNFRGFGRANKTSLKIKTGLLGFWFWLSCVSVRSLKSVLDQMTDKHLVCF